MNPQITISQQEYERLTELAQAAADLSKHFIPTINFGASAMTGDGVAAWNDFEIALRKYKESTETAA